MKKTELAKAAVEIIISLAVGAVVGNAIKATTPSNIGSFKKIGVAIGGFVLTSMVTDKATEYTEEKIDGAINQVKDIIANPQEQN